MKTTSASDGVISGISILRTRTCEEEDRQAVKREGSTVTGLGLKVKKVLEHLDSNNLPG